jgi:heme exporter protein D
MKLHWPPRLRHGLRSSGSTTWLALGMVLAALLALLYAPQIQRDNDALERTLQRKRQQLSLQPAKPVRAPDPLDQVRDYLAAFPPVQQNAQDISTLFQSAARHGIALPHADYQFKSVASLPLVTYSATLPVHGDYRAIRAFTADVLQALPHAALDELRMSRPNAANAALDTVVHFSLVYRRS